MRQKNVWGEEGLAKTFRDKFVESSPDSGVGGGQKSAGLGAWGRGQRRTKGGTAGDVVRPGPVRVLVLRLRFGCKVFVCTKWWQ
jgi:hypothetical protein